VIKTFKHKALQKFFSDGVTKGIRADHVKRVRVILALLDSADSLRAFDLPGLRLHPLKGSLHGYFSLTINGNWRLVFRFVNGDAYDVDYLDYH
jgi:proteic killer suppression protein